MKRERGGSGWGGLSCLGERQSLWSSRICTIANMEGGVGTFLRMRFAPCRMPFLVEVFKMLSMKRTGRSWEGERGNHQTLSLKQCLVLPRDQHLHITFLLSGPDFLLSPPHWRAQDFNYREGEDFTSVWKASRAFFPAPFISWDFPSLAIKWILKEFPANACLGDCTHTHTHTVQVQDGVNIKQYFFVSRNSEIFVQRGRLFLEFFKW